MREPAPPPPSAPLERPLKGIALRIGGAVAFALMAALVKVGSERGVTVGELIFYRNFGALPVVVAWILSGPGLAAVRTSRPLAHLGRSVLGLASMSLIFGALALLPLGAAITLTYSSPIAATILGGLLLGERIGARRWGAVLVGFAGVLLVIQPFGGQALPLLGIVVGLGSAIGQATVMITLRTVGRTEGTAAIVFWFTVFTTIAGACTLPFVGHWHGAWVTTLLIVAGMLGGVGQLGMTGSLRFAPVSVVVPFDYLQIVVGLGIGWGVFGDLPVATMLAGAALIAGSGIYTAYRERQAGRVPNEAAAAPLE